jgi:hypothetical protein
LEKLLSMRAESSRCCREGNLTKDWSKQSITEQNVHPTFAIAEPILTIDCGPNGPLAGMHAHTTNDGSTIP